MKHEDRTNLKRRFARSMAWIGTGVLLMLAAVASMGMPVRAAQRAQHEADGADPARIAVDNFSFSPATVTVPVGTTITWTNHDDIPHNVVSPEQKFKSPVLDTNETYAHTFDAAGTYKYYCSIHPRMTGQIVVR